jgi:hypothetical protein
VQALEDALYSLLAGDATLLGYLPGGVHNTLAPDPDGAYLVYQKVGSPAPGYTYRCQVDETYLYQVRIITRGYDKSGILAALARVRALLNLQSLVVAGHTHWRTTWAGDLPDMVEDDDAGEPWVQVGAQYRIELAG